MCAICGTPLTGRQQRYCSPLCSSRAFNAARKADGRLKEQRENSREKRAEWSRQNGHKYRGKYVETKTCEACGLDRQVRAGENPRTCGDTLCRAWCRDGEWPTCELRARVDMRSDLRRAIENRDFPLLVAALRVRSNATPAGCWEWTGRLTKDRYPTHSFGNRPIAIHRAVVETKERRALGSQAAHHACGNTRCVNPDHLQPVTAAANAAEMLARTYMVQRIAALEAALAQHDPTHDLLREVGIAS